ncbi:Bromodomain testis-specific protein [Cytospora mali]|uniref:Bromodomain testis-specific protein n=1 Tax=Cytospora mali TaxID=578113 RepID=A0A194VX91_CYTMA|nr:Bromodomain testis-specific protein [Valsa mali]
MSLPPSDDPAAAAATAAPDISSGPTASDTEAAAPNSTATEVTNGNGPDPSSFSWLDAHHQFVVVLVGPDKVPFGLQKDFLCAKSSHYRSKFAHRDELELIDELPNCPVEVFAFTQNFLYTGSVIPDENTMPSYDILVGVWKLGHQLEIDGLCDQTLEAMVEVRRATERIPAAPLLVQVWKDTPEGCSIRKLLLGWAAEYMHTSISKAEFAKSLPQDVLSELVVAMVPSDTSPLVQLGGAPGNVNPIHAPRKQVHYLDQEEEEEPEQPYPTIKKPRRPDPLPQSSASKAAIRKTKSALPVTKPVPRRRSNGTVNGDHEYTVEQKLYFCQDLLTRMLSGPGFWTRLVGPFKEPVDPVVDNVPDYFDKVTRPMDLSTMKAKMDRSQYTSDEEFLADMNQIFSNCKTYWKTSDAIYTACEKLEKTFLEKYSQMNKWLAKMEGNEEH